MKKEQIQALFEQFEKACYDYKGIECWRARDLQIILGYSKWDNFLNVIEKAKKACENAGTVIADHFADTGKMVILGSGSERQIEDIALVKKSQRKLAGEEKKVLKGVNKKKSK